MGFRLNFSPATGEIVHQFCGASTIAGGACPNCRKPLMRLLSLDAKDSRLELDKSRHPLVHLLYCWTCSIPFGDFSYKVTADGGVEILRVPPKHDYEFGTSGPYDGFTGSFPALHVGLRPLSSAEQDAQILSSAGTGGAIALEDVGHQVGGYPPLNDDSIISCPLCSKEMPFLAAICNDATGDDPFGVKEQDSFVGNGGVHMVFKFCRDCSVVSAYHSND